MAIRVDAEGPDQPEKSVSAGFELTGNSIVGGLTLYTPFGSTAAKLSWSQHDASLMSDSGLRRFPSLESLIEQSLGTDLPVSALFSWLAGENASAAGWTADLTNHADGRITAKRSLPLPSAELRILLEK